MTRTRSLNAHHLSHKYIEHMVESGRNVAVTSFHKLAGGRVGWQEVATYLIRSPLTLLGSVHQNKTAENEYLCIHYVHCR